MSHGLVMEDEQPLDAKRKRTREDNNISTLGAIHFLLTAAKAKRMDLKKRVILPLCPKFPFIAVSCPFPTLPLAFHGQPQEELSITFLRPFPSLETYLA